MYGKDERRIQQCREVKAIQRKIKNGGRIDHEASVILRHFTVSTQQYIEVLDYEMEAESYQALQSGSPELVG